MKEARYLHCFLDEKFIDGAISLFEEDERVSNTYVYFRRNTNPYKFKYIKSPKAKIQCIDSFIDTVVDFDVVVLHNLESIPIEIIRHIPSHIKVVWLMWGYDFYNYQVYNLKLYGPLSKKTLTLRDRIKKIKTIVTYWLYERVRYKESLARIDYFSGVFPYEYDLFKQLSQYQNLKARPVDFYYGSTNFFIPESPRLEIDNQFSNVIIGNSADPSNNTLEVFEILKGCLDVNCLNKIIVPLSYGNNKVFIRKVKGEGNLLWGEKFMSLDSYMPLDEYLKIVSNCKIAIYYHERQQASDNVFMQLMYGAKVYMSKTSLMYKYLKGMGLAIFSLQNDISSINEPLTNEEIVNNRTILSKSYSSSKLIKRVKIMNNTICNF